MSASMLFGVGVCLESAYTLTRLSEHATAAYSRKPGQALSSLMESPGGRFTP